jgi:methylated-DNA-[protein]-cysteine S-methyltransferase
MSTEYQSHVLRLCSQIPKGKVTTYAKLSAQLNKEGVSSSPRAVGQALRRNEHPIKIPCHRVISSSKEVCGYCGKANSLEKKTLLEQEGIPISLKNGKFVVATDDLFEFQ